MYLTVDSKVVVLVLTIYKWALWALQPYHFGGRSDVSNKTLC